MITNGIPGNSRQVCLNQTPQRDKRPCCETMGFSTTSNRRFKVITYFTQNLNQVIALCQNSFINDNTGSYIQSHQFIALFSFDEALLIFGTPEHNSLGSDYAVHSIRMRDECHNYG
jgi:hypothetical protein